MEVEHLAVEGSRGQVGLVLQIEEVLLEWVVEGFLDQVVELLVWDSEFVILP